ncbi:MAG TPA: proprotein convertase P-domain-containing protein [Ilumatobacteraceae bacterium]|nr:proprotein convertase P-domain-containing protein [Ilumatobacteraceae bacterium]
MVVGGAVVIAAVGVGSPSSVLAAPVTATFSYTGPPVPIPDGFNTTGTAPGAPASAAITVADRVGAIVDIDVRFDGDACTADWGATTVGLDHSFVFDLRITLTSPAGTTVTLLNRAGGYGNNLCQTLLDEDAVAPSILSASPEDAPFTGTWTPTGFLSVFDGEDANGVWTLTVQDFYRGEVGSIRALSVIVTTDDGAPSAVTKSVSGSFDEGSEVTYTVTAANHLATATLDNVGDEFVDVLPSGLALVSASATSGTAIADIGTNTVTWNGSIAAESSVTITIVATVTASPGTVISNQGRFAFDPDRDGTSGDLRLTDDPATAVIGDPTEFTVTAIAPTVSVEQAAGQVDPATAGPIQFMGGFLATIMSISRCSSASRLPGSTAPMWCSAARRARPLWW